MEWWFVSDLHGRPHRYKRLFELLEKQRPSLILMGGDLLPHEMARWSPEIPDFLRGYLIPALHALKKQMQGDYPRILLIPGNDDPAHENQTFLEMEKERLVEWVNMKTVEVDDFLITGYAYVPPTPFLRKDWEKYDVSRYVDPGCIHPYEGYRTADPDYDPAYDTIARDLERLAQGLEMNRSIFLMHSPPYQSRLDRAALDGVMVDHVPLDVHVGSIAIQRFITERQPLLTLHGHIHESSALTGSWQDTIGRTHLFSAAWDGPELALVRFSPH
ncbi:MAG TPA: metallophosphoesterase, partial [Bacteroidales bacterium]|nr:metallophosphoesterase [Bacteroidales bacterium]